MPNEYCNNDSFDKPAVDVNINGYFRRDKIMPWSGGLAEWIEGETAFLSVVFRWSSARILASDVDMGLWDRSC